MTSILRQNRMDSRAFRGNPPSGIQADANRARKIGDCFGHCFGIKVDTHDTGKGYFSPATSRPSTARWRHENPHIMLGMRHP